MNQALSALIKGFEGGKRGRKKIVIERGQWERNLWDRGEAGAASVNVAFVAALVAFGVVVVITFAKFVK